MKTTSWLIIILFGLIIVNSTHVIFLNIFTHSLPYGIYFKVKKTPQIDDFAATCLNTQIACYGIDRGYLDKGICASGTVLVLKIIKGTPKDHYKVRKGFLELNGVSYPIMDQDSSGRALEIFYPKEGIIGKDEFFLLSDFVSNSWDSRYWGPVSIQFLLRPLWLFDNDKNFQVSHP